MTKIQKQQKYICTNCSNSTMKWSGQCFDCGLWGVIEEQIIDSSLKIKSGNKQDLNKLDGIFIETLSTATPINELNRVLGGGMVTASAILIGGVIPGIGKSTLLLQLVVSSFSIKMNCLYVTGEESS